MVEIREYTDTELLTIKPVVIDPGTTDANGVLRGAHYRNPFALASRDGVPGARELSLRWFDLHWGVKENESSDDPFSVFLSELAFQDSGFHRHENSENGNTVFFPNVPNHPAGSDARREAESVWEDVCQVMHANQKPVAIEPKPQPNHLERGLSRGD